MYKFETIIVNYFKYFQHIMLMVSRRDQKSQTPTSIVSTYFFCIPNNAVEWSGIHFCAPLTPSLNGQGVYHFSTSRKWKDCSSNIMVWLYTFLCYCFSFDFWMLQMYRLFDSFLHHDNKKGLLLLLQPLCTAQQFDYMIHCDRMTPTLCCVRK